MTKVFTSKKILTLVLALAMVFSVMAVSAYAASPGTYTNSNGIYFYSITTGNPAPHGQNLIYDYIINSDGTVTLDLQSETIYGQTTYISYLTVTYTTALGTFTTIDLIADLDSSTGESIATIPADALSSAIQVNFATNGQTPEDHTTSVILKLDYLP